MKITFRARTVIYVPALGFIAGVGLITQLASSPLGEDSSSHLLEEHVVVANRTEVPIGKVGSSVEILTSVDFEPLKQSFLLEALRLVPGFYLRNNGGPGQVFGMTTRGLNTNRPVVLIDGIEVSNPASGEIINFGTLFLSQVERVEILKGSNSTIYGADSLAGVISISSKDGRGEPGSSLNLMAGSHDTLQVGAATWGESGDWNYRVAVSSYDSEGFSVQPADFGEAWADNDLYRNLNGSINIGYDISDTSSLHFLGYYVDSKAEYDPGNPDFIFGEPFADNYTLTEQFFGKVGVNFEPRESWESTLSVGYNNTDTFSMSSFPFGSQGERYEADWLNTVQISETYRLVTGFEYEEEEHLSDSGKRDETALFLENLLNMNSALALTLGGRFDDNSAYGEESTYRGTFSYDLKDTDNLALRTRGSFGTSFQAPTFFHLFSFFGNPLVKPESGRGLDLGLEGTVKNGPASFALTYFDYQVKDKITYDFARNSFSNQETYESAGLETLAKVKIHPSLSLQLSHTYARAEYEDGTEAERVPRNLYSAQLSWEIPEKKLGIHFSHYWVGSQYSLRRDRDKMPAYGTANFAVTYAFREGVDIWLRIDNLFDSEYQEVRDYNTPGLSVYAGWNFRF